MIWKAFKAALPALVAGVGLVVFMLSPASHQLFCAVG